MNKLISAVLVFWASAVMAQGYKHRFTTTGDASGEDTFVVNPHGNPTKSSTTFPGNVGIGTTNPAMLMHIHKTDSNEAFRISGSNNWLTVTNQNEANNFGIGPGFTFLGPFVPTRLDIRTNNISRMSIDKDGVILIGPGTVPAGLPAGTQLVVLPLASTGSPSIQLRSFGGPANFTFYSARMAGGTKENPAATPIGTLLGGFGAGGHYGTDFSTFTTGQFRVESAETFTPTSHATLASIRTTPSGSTSASERMRIVASGNVGIGTTNPLSKFHVAGGSITVDGASAALTVSGPVTATSFSGDGSALTNLPITNVSGWQDDGTNVRLQTITDNVGIGTTNPLVKLAIKSGVEGHDTFLASIDNDDAGPAHGLYIETTGANVNSQALLIRGNNGLIDILAATGGGRVGISTGTPQTNLDVEGDAQIGIGATKSTFTTTGSLQMANNAGISLSGPSGRIGIGTTNPTEKLHVVGNILAGSSVTASAFFGDGSGLTNLPSRVSAAEETSVVKDISETFFVSLTTVTATLTGGKFLFIMGEMELNNFSGAQRIYTTKITKDGVDLGFTLSKSVPDGRTNQMHHFETEASDSPGSHTYVFWIKSNSITATQEANKAKLVIMEQ